MELLGRKQEVSRIKGLLKAKRSSFLAITGRRRVGKTFLIDSLLKNHFCFSMTGIQNGNMATQLINFGVKLAEYGGSFDQSKAENWQQLFLQFKAYLKTLDTNRKQVIFIDELPWVSTSKSGFIQLLAHLWNDYLSKEKHFILVICGSATSWIARHILNDKGGLHNRVTETIYLPPFTLAETAAFLKSKSIGLSDQELAKVYMALGGIPYYLEKIQRGESFAAAIERLCFSTHGPLKNEYNNLYQALFNHADVHEAIIEALATHPYGISRTQLLAEANLQETGSFTRALRELIVSDFVRESRPFGRKKRGAVYRLIDEYSSFYHRFIRPNPHYTPGMWQQLSASQSYKIWTGYAFETLCFKHIEQIKQALGITGVYTEIYSLQMPGSKTQKGFQIDLVIDRKDETINLCEVKFYAGPFTIDKNAYLNLLEKRQRFIAATKTKKQVFYTFITNHGLAKNEYAAELADSEVVLEDLTFHP